MRIREGLLGNTNRRMAGREGGTGPVPGRPKGRLSRPNPQTDFPAAVSNRLRIKLAAVVVVSATEDTVQAAITDDTQCGKKAGLSITLQIPVLDLPEKGTAVDVVGVITRYEAEPFRFIMEQGTLQPVKRVKLSCPASQGELF
jgi:hypothetical protein